MKYPVLLSIIILSLCAGLLIGCGLDPDAAGQESTLEAEEADVCNRPVKVVFQQDKTGSATEHYTPQFALADLEPLFDGLQRCGGELAVGLINQQSNRTLTRLFLPEPSLNAPPRKPSENGNPFYVKEAMAAYEDSLTVYQQEQNLLARESQARIDTFKARAATLLESAPDAKRTDVWGAVRRAELLLAEPDHGWTQPPQKYMVIISDALDNAKAPPVEVPLKSGATVVLVNGAPTLGSLEALEPVRFESISSAIRYITQAER